MVLLASLRRLRAALPVRLASAAMVLRPRRVLLLRRALRARRSLWVGLLTATTATAELARRRLRRTTGSRSLHRVVHLVALIDVRLDGTRRRVAYGRMIVVSHRQVRRLAVTAASRTTTAGPAARAATNLGVASSSRRPVVSSSDVRRPTMARTIGTRAAGMEFPGVAGSARAATNFGAASSSRRSVVSSGTMVRSTVAWAAVVSGVNIWPTSRGTVLIPSVNIRPVSRPTVLITAVVGRTSPRGNHPSAREHPGALSCSNSRLSTVYRCAQVVITERGVLLLSLHRREGDVVFVFGSQLMTARLGVQATLATIEAHASHVDVVDHRLVVYVCDVNAAEV